MAKFSAHGGPRLLLNGEWTFFGCELKDPFRSRAGAGGCGGKKKRLLLDSPFGIHRGSGRGVRLSELGGVCSHGKKSSGFKSEERLKKDGGNGDQEEDEMDFDEFESDEFSCFRGLVLDISYRPVNVVCWKPAICLEFMEKADVLDYYDLNCAFCSRIFLHSSCLKGSSFATSC